MHSGEPGTDFPKLWIMLKDLNVSPCHSLWNVEHSQFRHVSEDLDVTPKVGASNIEFFQAVGFLENLKITFDISALKINDLYLCECPSQILEVACNINIRQVQDLHLAHVKTFNWTPNFGTIGQVQHSQPVAP